MQRLLKVLGLAQVVGAIVVMTGTLGASAKSITLGYVPASMEYPYNVATARGFAAEAKALGAKVIILDPKGSVETQADDIDDLMSEHVAGIAALPLDGIVAQTWVDAAAAQGIPFVAIGTEVGNPTTRSWTQVYPNLTALIGMNNVAAAELVGNLAAHLLPKGQLAKIAIVEGAPGYPQVWQRTQGFEEGLAIAGIKYRIVAAQPTDETPEQGNSVCQNLVIAHPDLDLIFSQADPMAIGCALALRAAGSKAKLIATAGGSRVGVDAIKADQLDGSVCDNPETEGRLAAEALYAGAVEPQTPKGQLISYPTPVITKDTLSACPANW